MSKLISVDEFWQENGEKAGGGFLLTTKFYKQETYAAILVPDNRNPEGKADLHIEDMAAKKHENTETKKLVTRKIYTNELHTKLIHPRDNIIHATTKYPHYIFKGTLEVCEDSAMTERNHKFQHKVAEERKIKPCEMINLDIISQKKPSYGGSKNWILIQDSDTKKNCLSLRRQKNILLKKSPLS